MKKPKTVDVTPSWSGLLPVLLAFVKDPKPSLQKAGYDELVRMAKAADEYNKLASKQARRKK